MDGKPVVIEMSCICSRPTTCNLCGGNVVYVSNEEIYGQRYGSGYAYMCLSCGAYTGTHRHRPMDALGLLANKEMRRLKVKCHELFDKQWTTYDERCKMYKWLAKQLAIPIDCCHFGYFDTDMLYKALNVLQNECICDENASKEV